MRPFSADVPVCPVASRFDGAQGVGLYIGPIGVDDPQQIVYRYHRPIATGVPFIALGDDWAPGTGVFLYESIREVVKTPTNQIVDVLPAGYVSGVFWAQLRPHDDGLELESGFGARRIVLDVSGDGGMDLVGSISVSEIICLDAGGLRIKFWFTSEPGLQPDEFVLAPTSGPTTPADVTVLSLGDGEYTAEVTGLTDAGVYGFTIRAQTTGGADTKDMATLTATADASGPTAAVITQVCEA